MIIYSALCFYGHIGPCSLLFSGVPVVSLESAERPNYFLAVSGNGLLQMEHWSRGAEFSRKATFIQHQGLFLPGHTSFELVGQPGFFLTLTHTAARVQRYNASEAFKRSSSFKLEGWNYTHKKCIYFHTKMNDSGYFPLVWQKTVLSYHTVWCANGATGLVQTLVLTLAVTQMPYAASSCLRKTFACALIWPIQIDAQLRCWNAFCLLQCGGLLPTLSQEYGARWSH